MPMLVKLLEMLPGLLSLVGLALICLHVRARYNAEADISDITGHPVEMRDAELGIGGGFHYATHMHDLRDFD